MRLYNKAIDAALDAWFQDTEWKARWREVDDNRAAMRRAILTFLDAQKGVLKPRKYRSGYHDGYAKGLVDGWNNQIRQKIRDHVRYHGLWSANRADEMYSSELINRDELEGLK